MVIESDAEVDFEAFFMEMQASILAVANKHGIKVHPFQAFLEEGGLHLSMSATKRGALQFYGDIWAQYGEQLGLPEYLKPGMSVIDPDTAEQWTILGLDPLYQSTPVRVMNEQMAHHWLSIEKTSQLQPL